MKKPVSCVIVANAHEARIFEKVGAKIFELNLLQTLEADLDTNHETPDTSVNSSANVRHGVAPHTDRRDVEKQKFAREIAKSVEQLAATHHFEELLLVASHKMVSEIENALSNALAKKINTRLTKDLLEFKNHEVKEYLTKSLNS